MEIEITGVKAITGTLREITAIVKKPIKPEICEQELSILDMPKNQLTKEQVLEVQRLTLLMNEYRADCDMYRHLILGEYSLDWLDRQKILKGVV